MPVEIRFEPTLFLFLGTSAGQVGWRLRELLHRAYGPVPVLRFLWLDTDQDVDPAAARWFSSAERVELVGFDGDAVLANLNSFPAIKAWWPVGSRLKPGTVTQGAKQIRLYGRLALFRMYSEGSAENPALIDRLRDAAEALKEIENWDATEAMSTPAMHYSVERGSVRVYIVFSTCGGTGSSMAFDVAYLCRHLLEGRNPTVIGVGVLPGVMDKAIRNETQAQKDKIRANTYAWFKESEYLLSNPIWRVAYPQGAPLALQATPFSLRFVVDIANQAGYALNSVEDIQKMLSQALFLDTGSSIGGAIRGFNANVSVLLDEFHGRRRAYSSLAAGSLIYPAERILVHCSARFGQDMIRDGLLAKPQATEVADAASALLGRLALRDAKLLEALLSGRELPNLNAPGIQKAATVASIQSLLDAQEMVDNRDRPAEVKAIAETAAKLLESARKGLEAEVATMAVRRGIPFTLAVLDLLTAEPAKGSVRDDTASFLGLRTRLSQQGVAEEAVAETGRKYREARGKLRKLQGGLVQGLRQRLTGKAWKEDLAQARSDCLQLMGQTNQGLLQLAAQREATNIYDQLAEWARGARSTLARSSQNVARAAEDLAAEAKQALNPGSIPAEVYELTQEALGAEYIAAYYRKRSVAIDASVAYQALAKEREQPNLPAFEAWIEGQLRGDLRQHARAYFAAGVESTSLLAALAEYYGAEAPTKTKALFDRLVRYCDPFWQFNPDSGITGQEGKSIIGVEDQGDPLIPAEYRTSPQYELKSTGFRHEISVVRIHHGLPAFLLRGMADWKALYDERRKGIDPLHIFPEAAQAEEVIPELAGEARRTFALAAAFDYIVQIGSWYYFDAGKDYQAPHRVHPGKENRLDQGRSKAEDAFILHDDLTRLADELVEKDIVAMGNDAAKELLSKRIAEHKATLAGMGPDNELRHQYQKEIQALESKRQQL